MRTMMERTSSNTRMLVRKNSQDPILFFHPCLRAMRCTFLNSENSENNFYCGNRRRKFEQDARNIHTQELRVNLHFRARARFFITAGSTQLMECQPRRSLRLMRMRMAGEEDAIMWHPQPDFDDQMNAAASSTASPSVPPAGNCLSFSNAVENAIRTLTDVVLRESTGPAFREQARASRSRSGSRRASNPISGNRSAGLPPGVWYDRVEHRYVVQCSETTPCGRKKRRYFGVSRFGETAARRFAIAARSKIVGSELGLDAGLDPCDAGQDQQLAGQDQQLASLDPQAPNLNENTSAKDPFVQSFLMSALNEVTPLPSVANM